MFRHVSIVMYHYVRDVENTQYPRIKALSLDAFRGQIAYIRSHYNVIGVEPLLAAIRDPAGDHLPPRALLLTFDDGYVDHYENVLPILKDFGMPGCFFPCAMPVKEQKVLEVNKIQFILAATPEDRDLVNEVFRRLSVRRDQYSPKNRDYYYQKLASDSRFDDPDVTVMKRLLQRELPAPLRSEIIEELFETYVTRDEAGFASKLYMSLDQLRSLRRNGMHVGSHGYHHYWLNSLEEEGQRRELSSSIAFLGDLGVPREGWTMCYPYGGHDQTLLEILREMRCGLGFATELDIADIGKHDPLLLPRLDTNDLPKEELALPNEWTRKAAELAGLSE